MGKTIKSQITMQMVISLVLAILVCELLSVSSLQNNMTTQAGNFVEVQAVTNANVVNEWLVEQGNIVHTIRNGVAFMNTKDTDQIMDYLEVNLAENEDVLMYYVLPMMAAYSRRIIPGWIWIRRRETGGKWPLRRIIKRMPDIMRKSAAVWDRMLPESAIPSVPSTAS